jgi:hypothetical protein
MSDDLYYALVLFSYGFANLLLGVLLERRRPYRIDTNTFEGEPPGGGRWGEWWSRALRERHITGLWMRAMREEEKP